ncbi:MAG: hypothetical protein JWN53_339 [Gemmatimonadetes bacterium]|jgi:hypothetical protein|nr:hypothetical protein [Gemmatimonadota bacterium]
MRRLVLAALSALALSACTDNTAPSGDFRGTYSLRTINGSNIPYTFPGTSTTVQSETMALNTDGSYTDTVNYNTGTYIERGFYTSNNGSVFFTSTPDSQNPTSISYQGSVSGSVLTILIPGGPGYTGYTSVYAKN